MSNSPLIPHDLAACAIEDALRLRVGRGRRYSYAALADATGISQRALESYTAQGSTPSLAGLLSLCAVLGPGFASDILGLAGQTVSAADDAEAEHMRVLSSMGQLTSQIAQAVEDGHVDHREAAQLRPLAQSLIEMLEPLARDAKTVPLRGVVR